LIAVSINLPAIVFPPRLFVYADYNTDVATIIIYQPASFRFGLLTAVRENPYVPQTAQSYNTTGKEKPRIIGADNAGRN